MAGIPIGKGTLLAPTPVVMVSCAGPGKAANIITLAWAGTVCSEPPMLSISVRPARYSHDIIAETGEFVVNLVSRDLLKACDFCGVKSGRDMDKFGACSLTPEAVPVLEFAPAIAQSPLYLACRVAKRLDLGTHTMFLADIIEVYAASRLMEGAGKLDLHKAGLVAYSHGDYTALSEPIGFFGFSVASPAVLKRRMPNLSKKPQER
jgi:flavin reductase (DIM6/NTAB) family NADH-FMN oxidoreductase RutF